MQTLTTDRLELVPLDPERDAESLHVMHGDPDHYPYAPSAPSPDVATTRKLLTEELEHAQRWLWALRLRPRSDALGTVGLLSLQGTTGGLNWGSVGTIGVGG